MTTDKMPDTTSRSTPTSTSTVGSLPSSKEDNHWSSLKESGTLTGMRFLVFMYRTCGRRIFSAVMYPVAIYFVLFRTHQRQSSLTYFFNHYAYAPQEWSHKPNWVDVFKHFKAFAEVVLDKLLAWTIDIKEEEFAFTSPTIIDELMNDERGQLIIGSHFGNLEYCRGFMQRYKSKVINILVYDKHSSNFVEIMQKENQDSRVNVFQVDEFDISTMLILQEKISLGEWVFIAGDRVPLSGLQHTVDVDFLGEKAPLPIGPYLLAKALACPVKLMFAYRDQAMDNNIVFDVFPLTDKLTLSRKNKMADLQVYAQQFADKLQAHCVQAPYQWFNFYSFWHKS